jgi:hypothetical protein
MDAEVKQSRIDYIAKLMREQKMTGNPRRFVVLLGWTRIIDWDRSYEIRPPEIPPLCPPGFRLWAIERADQPDLVEVEVIEQRGPNLWVKYLDKQVRFLIPRDDCRALPIPFRPKVVRRSDLPRWIGEAAARELIERRQARLRLVP